MILHLLLQTQSINLQRKGYSFKINRCNNWHRNCTYHTGSFDSCAHSYSNKTVSAIRSVVEFKIVHDLIGCFVEFHCRRNRRKKREMATPLQTCNKYTTPSVYSNVQFLTANGDIDECSIKAEFEVMSASNVSFILLSFLKEIFWARGTKFDPHFHLTLVSTSFQSETER